MRTRWLVGGGVVVAAVVAVVIATSGNSDGGGNGTASVDTEAVQVRDLQEVTTLAGTLGFPEGDPITSRLQGTVTSAAASGAVVPEGGILFAVDGAPVAFLLGTLPAFRDIGTEPNLMTITAQASGTVTRLPAIDDVLSYNDAAFWLNDLPVLVLPGDVPAWRNLDEGNEGIDVEQLEAALVGLGFDPGNLEVDGVFTAYTDSMIDTWQESVGLDVDGRFNRADAFFTPTQPQVVDVLVSVGDSVNAGAPIMVIETGQGSARRTIGLGDSGLAVRDLQQQLVDAGYDPGDVDGTFGSETEDAVRAFQEAHSLEVTGTTTDGTWTALASEPGATTEPEPDVLQLQEALARLGYPVAATGAIDASTTAAIEQWQADIGAEPDGVVDLGEVIFLPSEVRVTEALLTVGSPVNNGSAVLATSSSASVVLVDLPADSQDLLAVGSEVTVEMPDGSEAAGVVTEISGIAVRNADGDVVFETTIELVDASVGADLDQAPVDVLVVTDERAQVLAVPVTALVALAEGGYAVEAQQVDGSFRLVAVEPGLYADGWVEVTSAALAAGDLVVVP